jgi:hypothetical protein
MPFITSEEVKTIRNEVKKIAGYKFSVTKSNHSGIDIVILEGKADFGGERAVINHYHYKDQFSNNEEALKVVSKIMEILSTKKEQKEITYDSDYGSVPNYYININAGAYGKPYKKVA